MRAIAGSGDLSRAVDLYDLSTEVWSTAQLSVARMSFAATSVGNVALFAGGYAFSSALLCIYRKL